MVMAPAPVIFATFANLAKFIKFIKFITFSATDRTVVPGGDTAFVRPLSASAAVRVAYLRRSLHTRRVPMIPGAMSMTRMRTQVKTGARLFLAILAGVFLLCGAG